MTYKELKINTIDLGEINVEVEEYNRKEIKKLILEWIDSIEFNEAIKCDPDLYIYVEYNDGSTYSRSYQYEQGTYKKTGIKAVQLDDGYMHYVFGKYEFNEYGVLSVA
jgi:hypothetical protein